MADDRIYGGRGSDTLDGRDAASFTDTLVCGVGDADAARADTPDHVNGDCESVDQNHAPSDLTLSKASVAENEPAATVVGTISATDPDSGDTHTYGLASGTGDGDNGSFTVVGSELRTSAVFDYEAKQSLSVRIRGTDGDGATLEKQFTIAVTDAAENRNPVAVDDGATATEDTQLELPLSGVGSPAANDTDPDSDPLTVTAVSGAAGGNASISGGMIRFDPTADLCGSGAGGFDYTVSDEKRGTDVGRVTVGVTCVPDDPTAVDDSATVFEGAAATAIDVLANDTDPDGGPMTIDSVTQPANGTVVITGGGSGLTYQPVANFCGSDSFTYTLNGGSAAVVSVTIDCFDDPPNAVDDSATVLEDSGATAIDVLANDTDVDGGPKTIEEKTDGSNGTVTITGGGSGLTYQPDANFCGSDSFTYTLNRGSIAIVSVTVTCVDDPPTAVNDSATLSEDAGSTPIDALANDTDIDGGPMTIDSVTQPPNGTVVITGGGSGLTYEPPANFCGSDSFTYTLNGGSTATVSVTITCVDDPPTAVDDSATVGEDAAAAAIDVLANDTDPDGGAMTIVAVTQPVNGTVVITGLGNGLTYQPAANFCGSDSFTYTLNGGSTATVSVTVSCVDDVPTAVDDSATLSEDAGSTPIDVLANDTDIDGGPMSIIATTDGAHGTVVITGGGGGLTYQPAANFCGSDSFTYTLNGGSTATVSLTVTCVDDPPVAVDDTATVSEDAAATAIDVLANDTDIDGGPKSIDSVTQPTNGTVVVTGGGSGLTYQPAANFCGSDSFNYTLTPGGSTATVSVTVGCVDDPPTAVNDSATVLEDAAATAIDVLANDTDIDGGPKTINSATQPTHGTVVITVGGSGLTYQPSANYCNAPPGTAPDSFTYTLAPGGSTATVSVTVTCVNDPPSGVVNRSHAVTGNVRIQVADPALLVGVTDIEGDSFGATAVASGTTSNGGTYTISAAGGYTYNPPPGYEGSDSFSYQVCDTGSPVACASANVNLTISGMIWFIDNSAAAAGDGRRASPFNSLAGFNAVNDGVGNHPAAGEVIFIDRLTATDYTGPLTLQNTQKVLGKGASIGIAAFAGITLAADSDPLPSTGGTKPKITRTDGNINGINLASGNTLRGVEVGNTTGVGISGSGFGTLTVSETSVTGSGQALGLSTGSFASGSSFDVVSSSSGASGISLTTVGGDVTIPAGTLTGSTGTELAINGGAGSFSYGGSITNSAARTVSIQNKTGGAVTLSGAVTDTVGTGTGVLLSSNTGAAITFSGGVTLSTGANPAFTATGGGTMNVTGSANTLSTTTGTALNVANTTIGSSGLTFRSISAGTAATGPANGIVLNNTGTSGGLTIAGTGAANSGGTIQNTSGDAIVATNTQDLRLTRLLIQGPAGDGINASNLRGTNLLANSTIQDFDRTRTATKDGYRVVNVNTNLTLLTVTTTTFNGITSDAVNPGSNDGVFMEAQGTSSMALSVEGGSAFTEMFGDGVQVNGITGATGAVNVTVKDSSFNNAAVLGNGGISLNPFGAVNFTANVDNNTFDTIMRPVTNLGAIGGTNGLTATANITVKNNTLNNIIGARGITFTADGSGLTTLNIDNNNIDRLGSTTKYAISANMISSPANVRVTNNDIGQAANLWTSGDGTAEAIFLLTQNASTMTSLVSGNVVTANATLEVIRSRAIQTSSQNVTFSANTVTDSVSPHLAELAVATGTGTVTGGTICMNASGNVLPAAGVGVISLAENTGGTVNVTQASSAALSAANSNATVTIVGAPAFGAATCPTPP